MTYSRHDSLVTKLGNRSSRNSWRLWIEENGFDRLRRNDFTPNTPFEVRRRPGVGLIIEQALIGSRHVSSRRGVGILSYESQDLGSFASPQVRVRIHVGQIIVTPLLRFHSVAQLAVEYWSILGDSLITPRGRTDIRTSAPLSLPQAASFIDAHLNEANIVFATEVIGNQRPARVAIHGGSVLMTVAGQFLRAAGYGETSVPGHYER